MSTVALNNLLTYILSLGLSNRNKVWLADKLLESSTEGAETSQQKYVKKSLSRAMAELKEAKQTGRQLTSANELLEEMKQW